MKKTFITLSALFLLLTVNVSAQDNGSKKQEDPKKGSKDVQKAPAGGTRMAISTKGVPASKSSGTNTSTKAKPASSSSTVSAAPNVNADGTPKSNK